MNMTGVNKDELRQVLDKLNSGQKVPVKRAPAKFRDGMQLDTYKTLPAASDSAKQRPVARNTAAKAATQRIGAARTTSKRGSGSGKQQSQEPHTDRFAADYVPSAEHEHVWELSRTRRQLQEASEWALLDTLEAQMAAAEKAMAQQLKLESQEAARQQLSAQVAEHEAAKAAREAQKRRELEEVNKGYTAFRESEAGKAAAARERNAKLKAEQDALLAAQAAERARKEAKKLRLERAESQAARDALERSKAEAAARMAEAQAAMNATKKMNAEALLAKKTADAEQRRKDEELMQETLRTLDRQERERAAALEAFRANIAARAAHAGSIAVAANNARAEREERLIAQSQAKAAAEAEAKVIAEREKRATQAASLKAAHAAAKARAEAEAAAAREEAAKLRAEMQANLDELHASEQLTAAARRTANLRYKQCLEAQIREMELRQVVDDVGMDVRERGLNARLLLQARAAVQALAHLCRVC